MSDVARSPSLSFPVFSNEGAIDRGGRLGKWTNDDNDTGWLYTGLLARDRGKCHSVLLS
jgi:hypothetical protein